MQKIDEAVLRQQLEDALTALAEAQSSVRSALWLLATDKVITNAEKNRVPPSEG